jgi:anthranilate phosphoribosyltransferase
MKKVLQYLFEHKTLSREAAKAVLVDIGNAVYNEHEITAFMTVYLMRSITIEELEGFRDALLELSLPVDLGGIEAIDIVGTGGDGRNTFNISTLACFIVAGSGQPVSKHGNYGASSISGASNLMEQLGYTFSKDSDRLKKEINEAGICFLHAPLFHPALKIVGPVRKSLAMRTFFNMLGPLANPANPVYQLVGVYNLELARIYNYMLQQSGKLFTVIHSLDGYDEVSLTSDTKVITRQGERIMSPEQLGKRMVTHADLSGGNSVAEAARIFTRILDGEGTWAQNAVVLANAAVALHGSGKYADFDEAYGTAVESLESGRARACLTRLLSVN